MNASPAEDQSPRGTSVPACAVLGRRTREFPPPASSLPRRVRPALLPAGIGPAHGAAPVPQGASGMSPNDVG